MIFNRTPIDGLFTIDLEKHSDSRGWFARTYCKEEFSSIGHDAEWVQMNFSHTKYAGTIRGMHFQLPPFHEIKLIRCVKGKIFDVAIDLRENSPTFLKWFGVELSDENKTMIYIPGGFAHGILTLADDCELLYMVSANYHPESERGIRYDDPLIQIKWPDKVRFKSEKDANWPYLGQQFPGIKL